MLKAAALYFAKRQENKEGVSCRQCQHKTTTRTYLIHIACLMTSTATRTGPQVAMKWSSLPE
jgi:hypothetical protein